MMSREVSRNFFIVLGAAFGLFVGFLVGTFTSLATLIDIWFNYKIWTSIILAYFMIQLTFGVLLRKPWVSRNVYLGMLFVPIGYLLANLGNLVLYVQVLIPVILAIELISLIICLSFFSAFYSVVRLFTGLDSYGLRSTACLGYIVNHPKAGIVERVLQATGFQILNSKSSTDNNSAYLLCEKNELDLGVYHEQREDAMQVTFAFFKIANDMARKVEDNDEEVLDFKAQVKGMLDNWATRQIVGQYRESSGNTEKAVSQIMEDLGPLKVTVPTRLEAWKTLVSYPKNHPYIFSLFTTVLVIVVNIILFILGKR